MDVISCRRSRVSHCPTIVHKISGEDYFSRHTRVGEETRYIELIASTVGHVLPHTVDSSRNSEVIHAGVYSCISLQLPRLSLTIKLTLVSPYWLGLYYPSDSLKTRLCLRGRQLLYDYCNDPSTSVPYRQTGKLVVASEPSQVPYLESLHSKAQSLLLSDPPPWASSSTSPRRFGENTITLPTKLISGSEARSMEPRLSPSIQAALLSPSTGILDSHSFMESLEKDITETEGGELAYSTRVVRVDPYEPSPWSEFREDGWVVQAITGADGSATSPSAEDVETDSMLARTLINASGLAGPLVLNSLISKLGDERNMIPIFHAKGSYASYKGPGVDGISHLIYPCPETAATQDKAEKKGEAGAGFQSLGTHLTLDLEGNVRFGPDLEWISPTASAFSESQSDDETADFWMRHLVPDDSRLVQMYEAVRRYLPDVVQEGFKPDYVGIRPKLVGPGGGFQDFVLRMDHSSDFLRSSGGKKAGGSGGQMISLLGIESPGLTASLGIAEMVEGMLARRG